MPSLRFQRAQIRHPLSPLCPCVPITSRSCLCQGNPVMHRSCCCYNSMCCPSPFLVATTSHGIVPMTSHFYAQCAPLCQASGLPFESASLLLHHYALSKSILVLQQVMALHLSLTMLSHCIRYCTLVPPCIGYRHSWAKVPHALSQGVNTFFFFIHKEDVL